MLRLSIIVPIYNVEPYIERCLRSLTNQDIPLSEYEIICINDGSKDKSREVVVRLQKEFKNIILIDQENMGVSVARNNGIDRAAGKFILMIDADDFVQNNILRKRLDIMEYHSLEVGILGYIILNEKSEEEYRYDPQHNSEIMVLSGIDYVNRYVRGKSEIRDPHRSWAIFINRNLLDKNGLRYLPDVPYLEDGEFMARVICLAKRVVFINGAIYLRTTRPGSATQSGVYFSEKARSGFLKAANNLSQFKDIICQSKEQKSFLNQAIIHFTILFINSLGGYRYFTHYSELYNALKKGHLKKLETEGCSPSYRKLAIWYNFSLHGFYFYWNTSRLYKSMKYKTRRLFCT